MFILTFVTHLGSSLRIPSKKINETAPEHLMLVHKYQAIRNKGLLPWGTSSPSLNKSITINSRLIGTVFKILGARQSEICPVFS